MIEQIPAAAWTAITAMIAGAIAWVAGRSKNRADVSSVLSATSIEWINELKGEIQRLREKIDRLEAEIVGNEEAYDRLEERHARLVSWLRASGMEYPGEHETD
jgi:chromosome segregation ATPase